jgi:hypothetical protein
MNSKTVEKILGSIAYSAELKNDMTANRAEAKRIIDKILMPSIIRNELTEVQLIDALNKGITNHEWYMSCFPTETSAADFADFFGLIREHLRTRL